MLNSGLCALLIALCTLVASVRAGCAALQCPAFDNQGYFNDVTRDDPTGLGCAYRQPVPPNGVYWCKYSFVDGHFISRAPTPPPGSTAYLQCPQQALPCTACQFDSANAAQYCPSCPADSIQPLENAAAAECQRCPEPLVPATNRRSCACPPGSGLVGNECVSCPSGTYQPGTSSTCLPCAPGTYSGLVGAKSCTLCPASTYSTAVGADNPKVCLRCPAGQYSLGVAGTCSACLAIRNLYINADQTGCECKSGFRYAATLCTACPANQVAAAGRTLQCKTCEAGSAPSSDKGTCQQCPSGSYASAASASCTPCSDPNAIAPAGSTSESACTICESPLVPDAKREKCVLMGSAAPGRKRGVGILGSKRDYRTWQ